MSIINPDWISNGKNIMSASNLDQATTYNAIVGLLVRYLNLPPTFGTYTHLTNSPPNDAARLAYWNDQQVSSAPVVAAFRGLADQLREKESMVLAERLGSYNLNVTNLNATPDLNFVYA